MGKERFIEPDLRLIARSKGYVCGKCGKKRRIWNLWLHYYRIGRGIQMDLICEMCHGAERKRLVMQIPKRQARMPAEGILMTWPMIKNMYEARGRKIPAMETIIKMKKAYAKTREEAVKRI